MKLLIVDSAFLNPSSPFRYIEHRHLLNYFPSSLGWNPCFKPEPPNEDFDFGYTVGLQQAFNYLPYFEALNLKFCFTLYPGFTFFLHNPHSDKLLSAVLDHPLLHKVFVTMPTTLNYLKEKGFPEHRIVYHYGGLVTHKEEVTPQREKPVIWFCAWGRYQNEGTLKGFDLFYKIAQSMPDYQFAAYADWIWEPLPNLTLYPFTDVQTVLDRYCYGDIFLATGRVLDGKFDGFPTGGAVEAGISGCALVVSDPLLNNVELKTEVHVLIVNPEFSEVLHAVRRLCDDSQFRLTLADQGRTKLREVFDNQNQMLARHALFY